MAYLKFTATAGIVIRNGLVQMLKNSAFNKGLKIQIEEDRGWLQSNYRIIVEGNEKEVLEFQAEHGITTTTRRHGS